MKTFLVIGHWILNALLVVGCFSCLLLALFGSSSDATPLSLSARMMTGLVGLAFGGLGYYFIQKTLKSG